MHDCVSCGCACYCHGDIDDCQVETIEYAYMHCEGCGCHEDDEDCGGPYDDGDVYGDDADLSGEAIFDYGESEWDWIVRVHDEWIEPMSELRKAQAHER
jgi:hypothetical protein